MLVLTRRRGEKIIVGDGENKITITVTEIVPGKVRLGIEAPADVVIVRSEIEEEWRRTKREKK